MRLKMLSRTPTTKLLLCSDMLVMSAVPGGEDLGIVVSSYYCCWTCGAVEILVAMFREVTQVSAFGVEHSSVPSLRDQGSAMCSIVTDKYD
jgi:hypothetical protein